MRRLFYEIGYRLAHMPWDIGVRPELKDLVESREVKPGRAVDLGCGTGSNSIFLAKQGFDITGVDFSKTALLMAQEKAHQARVNVNFVLDNISVLGKLSGIFDFILDIGAFDDLSQKDRRAYSRNILDFSRSGTQFFMFCHEWQPRWFEKMFPSRIFMEPGEIRKYFGGHFKIDCIGGLENPDYSQFLPGYKIYLMKRN